MFYELAATAVLVVHLVFILFVLFGAVLAARWLWMMGVHLPVVAWGFLVEMTGAGCPLTYAENHLRGKAGVAGYEGGFIEHYLLWLIYPARLTREVQFGLAATVIVVNAALYGWVFWSRRSRFRARAARDRAAT